MRKSHPLLAGIESVQPYPMMTSESMYGIEPPPMQIDDFLPAGKIMGVTAYPGVGKTWLALEVARAVASGTPFLGRFRALRGGVLFVGSDSSIDDYAQQWKRLTRSTVDGSVVYEPARFLIQSPFMFEDRDEVRRLIRTHQTFEWGDLHEGRHGPERERGFHVILCDTVSRLTRANQNDNSEMEEVFRNVRWLAEATGAALVLLHHNAKKSEFNDGSDWRGAMSQIGALDSWIHLAPSRRDKYLVGVQYKKFRGITPDSFSYRMLVDDAESASLVASDEAVTVEQRMKSDVVAEAVREHVRKHPGLRAFEIRDALWPRFETGVAQGDTTVRFETQKKLINAVNNRLASALSEGALRREVDAEGKARFYEVETTPKTEVRVHDAPTDGGATVLGVPKARAARKRKKEKAK